MHEIVLLATSACPLQNTENSIPTESRSRKTRQRNEVEQLQHSITFQTNSRFQRRGEETPPKATVSDRKDPTAQIRQQ